MVSEESVSGTGIKSWSMRACRIGSGIGRPGDMGDWGEPCE